ncbi:hypothetical protein BT67DRAFT_447817 [Trichocladium antarcticum]|uniref:Uncharacterized protein n=1 Tax=Trichocladium antarcticum TaxID=1450529 RepID=A0AAN6UP13_9PEZI|nr:hypothetical protein BT67DRAFT_447817 [Trichocladium antarcticum]
MTFTGPAVVGGPDVTLTGTAESIHAQLLQLNPQYDPWDFPEYQEKMAAQNMTRETWEAQVAGVSKRSNPLTKRGWLTCNVAGNEVGNWSTQCSEGLHYLERLNGYCGAPRGHAGCSRVSCSHNCGIFLCNDNSFAISVWCGNLAGDAWEIIGECAYSYNEWVASVKGQVFRDGPPAWNTVVREASC